MKNENLYYFDFIKPKLQLLVDPSKINEMNKDRLNKVKKQLTKSHLEVLEKIIGYLQLVLVAKLCLQLENHYSEKWFKLKKCDEEAKGILAEHISSMDKQFFVGFIVELSYWLAKIEGEDAIKLLKNYLSSWAQWHKYLERKNKHKRLGVKMKEKLRVIMGDQVDELDKIEERRKEDNERFLAGKMHLFVNIDYELDFTKTENKDEIIIPHQWLGEKQDFRVIKESDDFIEKNGKKYSLREYYLEVALNLIDEEWIKSKDLLKQIITVYLVKRCQHGDQNAFNILFNLYKDTAMKLEHQFINSRSTNPDIFEMEGKVLYILSALLKGDNVKDLYRVLDKSQKEKAEEVMYFLNKKSYEALEHSYQETFMLINGQLLVLENNLKELLTKCRNPRNRLKKVKKESAKKEYTKIILHYATNLLHKIDFSYTIFLIINPNDLISISGKYNKFLYSPSKDNNLTTWLFGGHKSNFKGMIYYALSNMFDGRKKKDQESYDDSKQYEELASEN